MKPEDNKPIKAHYLYNKNVIQNLWAIYILIVFCLIIVEIIQDNSVNSSNHYPGYHAILSFLICAMIVIVSNLASKIITKKDDYYDN